MEILHFIHGTVGGIEKPIDRFAALWIDGRADADGDWGLLGVIYDTRANPSGYVLCFALGRFRHDEGNISSAESRCCVYAAAIDAKNIHTPVQIAARGMMAVQIVDCLHVMHVDQSNQEAAV